MVALKTDLEKAVAEKLTAEQEMQTLVLQLHSLQLKLQQKQGCEDSEGIKRKVEEEINTRKVQRSNEVHLKAQRDLLSRENEDLKKYILALQVSVKLYSYKLSCIRKFS